MVNCGNAENGVVRLIFRLIGFRFFRLIARDACENGTRPLEGKSKIRFSFSKPETKQWQSDSMTCLVRILSTKTVDSSPSILLISPDGSKTVVNCGEGTQRLFLEHGQKMSTMNRVCLTHLSHDSIGGLPGAILTTADIVKAAIADAKAALESEKNKQSQTLPGLDLIGPVGTYKFIRSLRHFMRRDNFEVKVREGEYFESKLSAPKKNKKGKGSATNTGPLHVQSIVCQLEDFKRTEDSIKRPRTEGPRQLLSFIFTTPPIQGKFDVDRAKALGIPPGPLYGQLKSGKSVTFETKEGTEKTVESSEVVQPGSPGIAIAILYYPTRFTFEQLKNSQKLNQLNKRKRDEPILELILHMTNREIFLSEDNKSWRQSFGADAEHVYLDIQPTKNKKQKPHLATPFHSAAIGAISRAQLCDQVYSSPHRPSSIENGEESSMDNVEENLYTEAKPLLEYVVIPRSKKGFCNHDALQSHWEKLERISNKGLEESGAIKLAQSITKTEDNMRVGNGQAELIFTGTGSALPCKHRNVSGIYLRMMNGNSMLLDVGEGTIGQLLRAKPDEDERDVIRRIKAVWISHPHADHHLGLLHLLAQRKLVTEEPLILLAPPNLFAFLQEYEAADSSIIGSYTFLDCRDISTKAQPQSWSDERVQEHNRTLNRLRKDLSISSCLAVPVAHCAHAFAIIIDDTAFGRLVYSGDCRPSKPLAEAGLNADLLIHEATFADGLEAEATMKRHSTVGEALEVAEQMKAKALILTHFSQRYPKIPPLANGSLSCNGVPIIFAFDFIKITPENLQVASMLTPALRLLYPEDDDTNENDGNEVVEAMTNTAKAAMNIPGLFAQKSLL